MAKVARQMTRCGEVCYVDYMVRFALILILAGTAGYSAEKSDPQYTGDGQLMRPENYREWVYLTSGLGMTYGPAARPGSPMFDNVFVQPAAYRAFAESGKWPDKTIFVLEIRSSQSHGSINKDGHFQTGVVAVEAAVKDETRFEDKWAYFGFNEPDKKTAKPFAKGQCFTCHNTNAAVENSFVQFYPTLLEVAKRKGTLKASYLAAKD